jgi:hypothetical protein
MVCGSRQRNETKGETIEHLDIGGIAIVGLDNAVEGIWV